MKIERARELRRKLAVEQYEDFPSLRGGLFLSQQAQHRAHRLSWGREHASPEVVEFLVRFEVVDALLQTDASEADLRGAQAAVLRDGRARARAVGDRWRAPLSGLRGLDWALREFLVASATLSIETEPQHNLDHPLVPEASSL
jgi:hypothetical protein